MKRCRHVDGTFCQAISLHTELSPTASPEDRLLENESFPRGDGDIRGLYLQVCNHSRSPLEIEWDPGIWLNGHVRIPTIYPDSPRSTDDKSMALASYS